MIAYYPSGTSGTYDRWTGVPIGQPSTPAAVRTGVADAAHFGLEVQHNLLAAINAAVASPFYRQVFSCASGLTTGQPAYLSDANTVALAAASGSGTSKVIGFVRDRTAADTGCYLAHFWRATGITTTTGGAVFLTNAGGYSGTAGTFKKAVGIGLSTTVAWLEAGPLDGTMYTGSMGGAPLTAGGTADSGSGSFAARFDHRHAMLFSGDPSYDGTGALASGASTTAARSDHTHQLDSGLAKEILVASISGNAESGNYRAVTVTLKDVRGNATGSRMLVEAWLADTGAGWETAGAVTGFTVASGITGDTPTANKRVRGITSSDGTITFHVTTDAVATFVFHATVQSKIYYSTLAFA